MTTKVAVVTGAGRGIGRAEALQLAGAGFAVVVNDLGAELGGGGRDQAVADEVVAEISSRGGVAVAHCGDVGNPSDVAELLAMTLATFGRLDVLVNNAGNVTPERVLPDIDIAELDSIYHVHVRGSFNTSIAATRHWREVAGRSGKAVDARIVNTSSDGYLLGSPWRLDYAAAKAGIVALTMGTAATCSRFGVRVNAILPRAITRMSGGEQHDTGPSNWRTVLPPVPQNAPDCVAAVVVALCGPLGANINGQVIGAGGGGIRILAGPTVAADLPVEGAMGVDDAERVLGAYFAQDRPTYGPHVSASSPMLEPLRPHFDFLAADRQA